MGARLSLMAAKTVSKERIFNNVSDTKLKELATKQIKRRSLAKMQWSVLAFQEWREHKLQDFANYGCNIF